MRTSITLPALIIIAFIAATIVTANVCLIATKSCGITERSDPQCKAYDNLQIRSSINYNGTHCGGYPVGRPSSYSTASGYASTYVLPNGAYLDNSTIGVNWCAVVQTKGCTRMMPCDCTGLDVQIYEPIGQTCNGLQCDVQPSYRDIIVACSNDVITPFWR